MAATCSLTHKFDYEKHMMLQIESVFKLVLRDSIRNKETESALNSVHRHILGLQSLIKKDWDEYYKYSEFYDTLCKDVHFERFFPVLDLFFENQEQLYVFDGLNEQKAPEWFCKAFYLYKITQKLQNEDMQKYMLSKLKELKEHIHQKTDLLCNHKS